MWHCTYCTRSHTVFSYFFFLILVLFTHFICARFRLKYRFVVFNSTCLCFECDILCWRFFVVLIQIYVTNKTETFTKPKREITGKIQFNHVPFSVGRLEPSNDFQKCIQTNDNAPNNSKCILPSTTITITKMSNIHKAEKSHCVAATRSTFDSIIIFEITLV